MAFSDSVLRKGLFMILGSQWIKTFSRWVWDALQPPAGPPPWSDQAPSCYRCPQCTGHSRFFNRSRFSCGKWRAFIFKTCLHTLFKPCSLLAYIHAPSWWLVPKVLEFCQTFWLRILPQNFVMKSWAKTLGTFFCAKIMSQHFGTIPKLSARNYI